MSYEWCCSLRNATITKKYIPFTKAIDHPLKQQLVSETRAIRKLGSTNKSDTESTILFDSPNAGLLGLDPLSQFANQESIDPLSLMVSEMELSDTNLTSDVDTSNISLIWRTRRAGILNKFTTSEKLTITSSYLTGGEIIKTQTTMSQKVKHRLDQLDDFEDGSIHQMQNLTQHEYILKIEQLNQELVQAWHSDQRVKALKIAIQCSKLLSDNSVMQFYPSKFVLVTDILDIFGQLIFDRLRTKADHAEPGTKITTLPENFTPDMVPEAVKETCQNWFYKVASIRELLPRLYVEIAIMKSYSFLTQNEFSNALLRLTKIIRGIGDPLVAAYARCYLCRVGMTLTSDSEHVIQNFNDLLFVYHTILNTSIKTEMIRQHIDLSTYLSIYTPAIDFIMSVISLKIPEIKLDEILEKCQEKNNNGLLINSIMISFKPTFISNRAVKFGNIIEGSVTEGMNKGQLLRSLGMCLNQSAPPFEQRVTVWNIVSNIVNTITSLDEYVSCIEPWSQFVSVHFTLAEINTFLSELITRISKNRAFENYYHELQSITDKIVVHAKDFQGLIISDNFLPLIDLFQKESIKLDVCKNIMLTYKFNSEDDTSDPVITNAFMYICKVLSDSVNALTVNDERRQISNLICNFIRKVHYGNDFEQQLTFYVEARAAFPNLDTVLATLVFCVNKLAIDTRSVVYGQHTRKTVAFVKGCAAYCFITIPSIVSVITRLDLYLLSGKVALVNLCLGQADACFEAAINLIPELPKQIECEGKQKSTESYLVSFVCNFLSTLIIVPDSPDQGVLYLTRLLIEKVQKYRFDSNTNSLSSIYLHVLDMLTVSAQESYPYHIPKIVSNDELYGSGPKFINEINITCSQILDQILKQLKLFGDTNQIKLQCNLALDLFSKIIFKADISKEKLFGLAINLWNLAMKNKNLLDVKLPGKTLMEIEHLKNTTNDHVQRHALEELTTKMKIKM